MQTAGQSFSGRKQGDLSPEIFNDSRVMSVRVPGKEGGTRAPNTGCGSFLWVQMDAWDMKALGGQRPVSSSEIFPITREDGSRYGQLSEKAAGRTNAI